MEEIFMPDTLTQAEMDALLRAFANGEPEAQPQLPPHPKSTILLVDDAAFMRMMQKDILEKNGYEVCGEAVDGLEAIEKYKQLKPDLVILDITMPNMDGLTALKELKKIDPGVKILMVSAMGQEAYVADAVKHGASDFIVKPFQADKMIAGAYAALNKKMPVIPDDLIAEWERHRPKYQRGNAALTQQEIDELITSYILFAQSGGANKIDTLTGCLNKSAFDIDFNEMIVEAEAKYEDLTLVMLDIDYFKRVNDEYGHKAGDEVLAGIGEVMLGIPSEHKTYRYSGDSFALLFPNCEKEQVFLIMEDIRKRIFKAPEYSRTLTTISVGIATYAEDGNNDVELIRKADGALYRAKTSGRNKVSLAKEEKLATKTSHYTIEQLKRLEKLAGERGISEAALMREALDELLKKYNT
jgi:two-component system chemotaxis response regulator CheY